MRLMDLNKKRKLVVSREIKENHMTIIVQETEECVGNFVLNELRKTIRRANRFSGKQISFEILIVQKDSNITHQHNEVEE